MSAHARSAAALSNMMSATSLAIFVPIEARLLPRWPKSDIFEATPSPLTSVFRASLELLALAASFSYVRRAQLASPARGR